MINRHPSSSGALFFSSNLSWRSLLSVLEDKKGCDVEGVIFSNVGSTKESASTVTRDEGYINLSGTERGDSAVVVVGKNGVEDRDVGDSDLVAHPGLSTVD